MWSLKQSGALATIVMVSTTARSRSVSTTTSAVRYYSIVTYGQISVGGIGIGTAAGTVFGIAIGISYK